MPDPKPEEVGRRCPKCKSKLIYRHGKKTGLKFIGCSSFPKCKYVEFPGNEQKVLDEICPLCGKHLIERKNKRGQPFIGCSGYPACHYIKKVPKVENNDNIKTENNNQELPELKEFK
jgi:DNA topoisomerase-1